MKRKSGLADSPFFSQVSPTVQTSATHSPIPAKSEMAPVSNAPQAAMPTTQDKPTLPSQVPVFSAQKAVETESNSYKDSDSKLASLLSGYHDSSIQFLRQAVRFAGKEAFFGRFTPEEKRLLKEIAYTYQINGVKTNENEIARIALNLLAQDYREQGENSILARVLRAIHE